MEELHKYIAAARQYGHTDDQIRSNLAAAGWHPAHVASAIGNSTSAPAPKPGRSRRIGGKKLIVFTAVAILVLAGAAGTAYKFRHTITTRLETPHAQPSITLYYDDGKTVLWQDTNPAVEPTVQPANAPYFVDLVRTELRQKYGDNYWKQGAWQVTTSLSSSLQATAEKLVADNYANIQNLTGGAADEEATVLQDTQTGQIKALVGGTDRSNPDHGQINFATMPIEPGTSVFPFAYANLIEHTTNTGAGSIIADTQTPFPGYPCTNKNTAFDGGNCLWDYDLMYPGNLSVRYALGGARNVPAMQAIYAAAGTSNTVQTINQFTGLVRDMGASGGYNCYSDESFIKTAQCYGGAVMGDGAYMSLTDETHALSTFANGGKMVPQTTIISVKLNDKVKSAWQNPAGK